ncbi:ABC transporter permease [Microbacterium sp. RD1]|uniref:ABC transporter permease n=1 Tax=Microbacterium sp. RD1 TaxID=3457313 RepID=UPI003FA6019B
MNRSARRALLGLVGVAAWLAVWQWSTTAGPLAGISGLPSASSSIEVAVALGSSRGFWGDILVTFLIALGALLIALVIGLILGVLTGTSAVAHALMDPLVQFLRPLPPVVLLPLALLLLGPSTELAVFLAVFSATWPILVQVQAGVHAVDPVALETARSMTLPWWRTQWSIVIPSALPFLATGVRIAAAASLMLAVGAGILAGAPGIGRTIVVAQELGQAPTVFAIILWSGLLGLAFALTLGAVERSLTRNFRVSEAS